MAIVALVPFFGREGWQISHKRVLRVTGEDNLLCLRSRPFIPRTTDSKHSWRVVPNLARGMELTGLKQLWVADITYLHLAEQFAYLQVVLDAFSRKVIGWALELHLRASLAVDALKMAIAARRSTPGLIHHSDRGIQGRFKRSSQHSEVGGCDEHSKAEIGTVGTSAFTFTRTAACGGER
ncbi:hypothetical protein X727_31050 [Mesorhizobium sp. L103C119B0]|uniref:DDE-type integrase/transposase/recombinase n=1 Tax=Mesorhizobium sp. L103C119B0 TaxID=1287085 RepID=UPI0003D035AC|nr:DDE-type integrase/transposase/recombinase [Mesorhizobium sp. L103C119B0]ESZ60212.1 hypothetical protein X727_31050 [Mesorhizobium sp. L103C119B0]